MLLRPKQTPRLTNCLVVSAAGSGLQPRRLIGWVSSKTTGNSRVWLGRHESCRPDEPDEPDERLSHLPEIKPLQSLGHQPVDLRPVEARYAQAGNSIDLGNGAVEKKAEKRERPARLLG